MSYTAEDVRKIRKLLSKPLKEKTTVAETLVGGGVISALVTLGFLLLYSLYWVIVELPLYLALFSGSVILGLFSVYLIVVGVFIDMCKGGDSK